MIRRAIVFTSLLALAGCKMTDSFKPKSAAPPSAPAFAISDGAHLSGNPDFFFLPPMVPDPSGSPNFDAGAFNPNLKPTVKICQVNGMTEAAVNAGSPGADCKAGGYSLSGQASVQPADQLYQLDWKVPDSPVVFYKIAVWIGFKRLGFADVETANDASSLRNVNTGQFVPLKDGRTLPIKFRIENRAVCDPPGPGPSPCTSATVDLAAGGTVQTTLPNSTGPSGITIPPQGGNSNPVTITIQTCPNLNDRAIDLPTFGSCVRITSDPPLPAAFNPPGATAFICDLNVPFGEGGVVLSHNQEHRITMHRLDGTGEGQTVKALPHTTGCPVGGVAASTSLGDFFHSLAHGQWKAAGAQAAALLGPTPLYAYRFLDQGGGGLTDGLSDFQFALPAKMLKFAGDNQTAPPGTTLPVDPTVLVSDLGDEPVRGARVTFTTGDGSVAPAMFVTGIDGKAHAAWTIRGTAGSNSLQASGRGIGGVDPNNGPREGIDPFQPIQPAFPGGGASGPILLQTGSQTFSATGFAFIDGFELESGWTTTPFWNRSTLRNDGGPIHNAAFPTYVDAAPGDASAGAFPSPFAGSFAFWYGNPAAGNYLGPQVEGDAAGSGGTSTAPNTGTLTSPQIVLPTATGMSLILRFNTWWEIESVTPNNFDLMQVSIQDVGTSAITPLGVLNPSTNPPFLLKSTPFTSGGFNTPPVWVEVVQDVSSFRGKTIRLIYTFNTVDVLYNGFRGWIIDNVRLTAEAPVTISSWPMPSGVQALGNASQQAAARPATLNPVPPLIARPQQ